jgi:hypothetical protein
VRSGSDVPTFATRRLHACHHARALSGGRWNCGREMSGKFCLNADFHVTFRDLLHAVKLRHGTDGFGRVRTRELGYVTHTVLCGCWLGTGETNLLHPYTAGRTIGMYLCDLYSSNSTDIFYYKFQLYCVNPTHTFSKRVTRQLLNIKCPWARVPCAQVIRSECLALISSQFKFLSIYSFLTSWHTKAVLSCNDRSPPTVCVTH